MLTNNQILNLNYPKLELTRFEKWILKRSAKKYLHSDHEIKLYKYACYTLDEGIINAICRAATNSIKSKILESLDYHCTLITWMWVNNPKINSDDIRESAQTIRHTWIHIVTSN